VHQQAHGRAGGKVTEVELERVERGEALERGLTP